MLRSLRLGEADRVLHLYTLDRGRVGRGREGNPAHEVPFRRAPRAALARRAAPPPGERRARDGDGRRPRPLAPRGARAALPARRRARRRRGDAAALHRAGAERAGVHGAHALPRPRRRAARRAPRRAPASTRSRSPSSSSCSGSPATSRTSASCAECGSDAPLVGYLPKAGGAVCSGCSDGRAARLAGGLRRDRRAAAADRSPRRARCALGERPVARGARRRLGLVRVPRRLPAAHAVGLSAMRLLAATCGRLALVLAGCGGGDDEIFGPEARAAADGFVRALVANDDPAARAAVRGRRRRSAPRALADAPAPRRRPHRRGTRERPRELPQAVPGLRPAPPADCITYRLVGPDADRELVAHARDDGALPRLAHRARTDGWRVTDFDYTPSFAWQ